MIFSSRRKRPITAQASRERTWTSIRWLGVAGAACLFTGAWAYAQSPTYTIKPKEKDAPKVYTIGKTGVASDGATTNSPYNAAQPPTVATPPIANNEPAQPKSAPTTKTQPATPATAYHAIPAAATPTAVEPAIQPVPIQVAAAPAPAQQPVIMTVQAAPIAVQPVIQAMPVEPPAPEPVNVPAPMPAAVMEAISVHVVHAAPAPVINVPVQPVMVPVVISPAPIRTVTLPMAEAAASAPAVVGPELVPVQFVQQAPQSTAFPPPPTIVQTAPVVVTPAPQAPPTPTPTPMPNSPTINPPATPNGGAQQPVVPTPPGPTTSEGPGKSLADYGIETDPPRLDRLYRVESESALRKRIAEEIKRRPDEANQPVNFPSYRRLTDDAYTQRQFGGLIKQIEPNYVAYRRLYAQELNSERFGWWLGPIQPLWSTAAAWKDMAFIPYKAAVRPRQRFDTSAGLCYPGDPVPYLIPPSELSAPGALAEAALFWGIFAAIP